MTDRAAEIAANLAAVKDRISAACTAVGRSAEEVPRDGYTQSIDVTLPPLTTLVFKWSPS